MSQTAYTIAAIKKAEGPIPELRPPRGKIPFDLPEGTIFVIALAFAFAVLLIGRVQQVFRPLPPPPLPRPIVNARVALEKVSSTDVLPQCDRIVRRYLQEAFEIGPEGATTSELCAQFLQHRAADPGTAAALENFLCEMDLARFAPLEVAISRESCVARTRELLERLETRRSSPNPPPLPILV